MRVATRPLLARITAIASAIGRGDYPNARTLARDLEVNARTILRDIDYMRHECGAPIKYDEIHHGYYYTQANYSLPAVTLTEGELVAFILGGIALKQFANTPFAEELDQAFSRLAAHLPDEITIESKCIGAALSATPSLGPTLNPSLLRTLTRAVHDCHTVEFAYWTASRNANSVRTADPYALRLIDGTLYLIGYCRTRRAIRMFAAHRIGALRMTGCRFERPSDFSIEQYFASAFRTIRGNRRHTVALRFSPAVARRVQERVWHPSQRFTALADGGVLLTFELSDLREVMRWALSWGRDCVAVKPKRLVAMMREEVQIMDCHYRGETASEA